MTIDELKAKVPEKLQPWVDEYGPALLAMTGDEFKAWLNRLIVGDIEAAYRSLLAKMDNSALLNEWDSLNADWTEANARNAERIALQKSALTALMRILLAVALAAAGL